ncbi:MAG: immunity 17 family protein [Thermoclostridium sp.]|nr:immunity 17 family protein [Thermoclostridium sp.]
MEAGLLRVLLVLTGLFCIVSSICNWNFFFENRKAYIFVKLLGRNGARIFYGILGIALAVMAFSVIR